VVDDGTSSVFVEASDTVLLFLVDLFLLDDEAEASCDDESAFGPVVAEEEEGSSFAICSSSTSSCTEVTSHSNAFEKPLRAALAPRERDLGAERADFGGPRESSGFRSLIESDIFESMASSASLETTPPRLRDGRREPDGERSTSFSRAAESSNLSKFRDARFALFKYASAPSDSRGKIYS